ncbi:hypothetical protein EML15_05015 [Corynebacterium sp. sy017]|uniref:MmpS family transport accessory protein n=1 Tax=unclassified Corynebacterium TaxID=2624378 RepID=UPI001186BCD4|nr:MULTISPECIES: MmpS family transport accessory protein [unclassified Corynebacterium]MBP3088505.1 hypothetical protein [Corynebacterium sp. sy017]TSD91810.1 hypothetical protein ELY17_05015 [Corynebacterium sp. SY003]
MTKKGKIIAGVIGGLVVLAGIGAAIGGDDNKETTIAQEQKPDQAEEKIEATPESNTLTYVLESDGAPINANYIVEGANVSQEQGVESGWTKDLEFENKWKAIGTNVMGQLQGSGSVTCKILWNGEVISENTSTGDYAVVTCTSDTEKM